MKIRSDGSEEMVGVNLLYVQTREYPAQADVIIQKIKPQIIEKF